VNHDSKFVIGGGIFNLLFADLPTKHQIPKHKIQTKFKTLNIQIPRELDFNN
jgi:hypothetical protein